MQTITPVSAAELDTLLDSCGEDSPPPMWLVQLTAKGEMTELYDEDLMDIASEGAPGSQAAIEALFEGLRVRHQGDRVTLAALDAFRKHHVPALFDAID